jgi:predicted RecA/RadA family phage recombinase
MAQATGYDSIRNARTLLLEHTAEVEASDIIVNNGNVLVAVNDAEANEENSYIYLGKVIAPKVAGTAFNPGDKLYWDESEGEFTKVTSGNTLGGFCVEAAASADTTCVLMLMPNHVLTPPASDITISDAGGFTAKTNVEEALAEIYQSLISVQGFIPIPLTTLREATSMAVGNIAANGGVLASDTTPILKPINGGTDGCQELEWVASNNDQVLFSTPLPPDLDDGADLVLHARIKSEGTTDAVGFTVDSWFNEGDTKVVDESETNQTATWAEKITTIAHADVPAGAQTLTVGLTPVAHTTDKMYCSSVWLEYKTKMRTA